jgi:hypothetical protein
MKKTDYYVELKIDGFEDADEQYQAQSVWCKTKENAIKLGQYLKEEITKYGVGVLEATMPWEYMDKEAIKEEKDVSKYHFHLIRAEYYDEELMDYDLYEEGEIK